MQTAAAATVESSEAAPVSPTPNTIVSPVAPIAPAVKAPHCRGPREARIGWEALCKELTRDGELTLDMSDVAEVPRPVVAQIIRFLQAAERRNTAIRMIDVPPKTHAMLEILGIHHLVEIRS